MSGVPDSTGSDGQTGGSASSPHHARLMDANYAMQRHIYDATRKYYLLGRDRLIHNLNVPDGGHVLELGCGTARNIVVAARCYPKAYFHGLDISEEMLKSAQKNVTCHGVAGRCVLAQGDATDFDAAALWGCTQFDRIFCSYTLSMIPGWEKTVALGCSLLAPGGELHIVDFGQQENLPGAFQRLLQSWLTQFHVTPRADLFAICDALAMEHQLICQTQRLYRDYARAVILKHA